MSNLLVVSAADDQDRTWHTWRNVEFTLRKHLPTLGRVLVYTGHQDGAADSPIRRLLLCSCSISSSSLNAAHLDLLRDFVGVFREPPEFRLYKPLGEPFGISSLTSQQTLKPSHILLSVSLTPRPSADEEFNNWYNEEHIPLLIRVPTWLSSERFILEFSGNGEVPQYLALHRWDSAEALKTDEFKAATSTPRTLAVISEILKQERFFVAYEGDLVVLAGENTESA